MVSALGRFGMGRFGPGSFRPIFVGCFGFGLGRFGPGSFRPIFGSFRPDCLNPMPATYGEINIYEANWIEQWA